MKNHLLILSAELISKEMQKTFGEIPPILLPYGEKTVLAGTCEANKKKFEIEVISSKESQLIEKSIKDQNMDIKLTVIDKLDKIEKSILASEIKNQNNLTIVFGDTTLKNWSFKDYIGDKVAYVEVSDPLSWTTFEVEKELRIYDKVRREFKEKYQSFAGIFSFSNPKLFFEILEKNKDFYKTILAYNKVRELDFVFEPNWVDLGHQEEFNKNTEVQARYFNEITVNREKGILTKKSTEVQKFINEIKWYLKIPKNLEYLTPRIFSYDISFENPSIVMEYYNYPTLHSFFINSNHTINKWNKIFDLLLKTNLEMRKNKLELTKRQIEKALMKIYLTKTLDRLEELKNDEYFKTFFTDKIKVNDEIYPSLADVSEELQSIVKKNLLNLKEFSVIHGDYFFANILYDGENNFLRLIDPRGDFGGYGIYGDYRYDLAKLAHSVDGKYDFVVTDKFQLNYKKNEINFKINSSDSSDKIKNLFFDKIKTVKNEVLLIESLLFLSMVPLHKDFPNRQKVMLAIGLKMIYPYMEESL